MEKLNCLWLIQPMEINKYLLIKLILKENFTNLNHCKLSQILKPNNLNSKKGNKFNKK